MKFFIAAVFLILLILLVGCQTETGIAKESGWVDGWVGGWMDGWMDGWMSTNRIGARVDDKGVCPFRVPVDASLAFCLYWFRILPPPLRETMRNKTPRTLDAKTQQIARIARFASRLALSNLAPGLRRTSSRKRFRCRGGAPRAAGRETCFNEAGAT